MVKPRTVKPRTAVAFVAALGLAAASCQALLGIDPDVNVLADTDAPPSSTTDGGDGHVDTIGEGGPEGDVAPPPLCPVEAGGPMVPVGPAGYCIDRTEVTVAAYRQFLDARAGDTSGQRADCTSNTSFIPSFGMPTTAQDQLPIRYVDFCDALAFCAWAGKRLCGDIDGGSLALDAGNDPQRGQWYRACSRNKDGLHTYPYGQTFDPTRCNSYLDGGSNPRSLQPVASYPGCEGGYPDLFDMGGNIAEWEDSCGPGDGGVHCSTRGGSFNNGFAASSACSTIAPSVPTDTENTIGLRCCSL